MQMSKNLKSIAIESGLKPFSRWSSEKAFRSGIPRDAESWSELQLYATVRFANSIVDKCIDICGEDTDSANMIKQYFEEK